jgi:hypothetical protein
MTKEQLKQAIISVLIGVSVTIISSLSDVLITFIKSHAQQIVSGMSATAVYLAKAYKA